MESPDDKTKERKEQQILESAEFIEKGMQYLDCDAFHKTRAAKKYADLFRVFFDKALDSEGKKELFLSSDALGYRSSTLQNRISQGLKYLASVDDRTGHKYIREDYERLRLKVRFAQIVNNGIEGILMRYVTDKIARKYGNLNITELEPSSSDSNYPENGWKAKVIEFVNDDEKVILDMHLVVNLDEDAISYINKLFLSLDYEFTVTATSIKAVK